MADSSKYELPLGGKGATTVLKLSRVEAPKAPRGWGVRRRCPLPTVGGVWGGAVSPPRKIFDFFKSENGEFWCILGGASALYVATASQQTVTPKLDVVCVPPRHRH